MFSIFLAIKYFLIKLHTLFFRQCYCPLNRLQYEVSILIYALGNKNIHLTYPIAIFLELNSQFLEVCLQLFSLRFLVLLSSLKRREVSYKRMALKLVICCKQLSLCCEPSVCGISGLVQNANNENAFFGTGECNVSFYLSGLSKALEQSFPNPSHLFIIFTILPYLCIICKFI